MDDTTLLEKSEGLIGWFPSSESCVMGAGTRNMLLRFNICTLVARHGVVESTSPSRKQLLQWSTKQHSMNLLVASRSF
jgi:hypothetical protein